MRLHKSLRITPAMAAGVSDRLWTLEELVEQDVEKPKGKRGPVPKLQQQLDTISALPKPQQRFVMQVLETVLAQASR